MKSDLKANYKKILFIFLPILILFIAADLTTKYLVQASFFVGESRSFIPKVIDLVYVNNTGAAWSMFSGAGIFLIVFTFLFCIGYFLFYLKEVKNNALFHISSGLILAGCIGNLYDRLAFSYVRDMIHFEFWPSFPVFNIADICVTVGVALLIIYYLIYLIKTPKTREMKR